jgi:hypothetical protein
MARAGDGGMILGERLTFRETGRDGDGEFLRSSSLIAAAASARDAMSTHGRASVTRSSRAPWVWRWRAKSTGSGGARCLWFQRAFPIGRFPSVRMR